MNCKIKDCPLKNEALTQTNVTITMDDLGFECTFNMVCLLCEHFEKREMNKVLARSKLKAKLKGYLLNRESVVS